MNKVFSQLVLLVSTIVVLACSGSVYRAEKYVSRDSADELGLEIYESIKSDSVERILALMANDTLIMDVLLQTKSEEARQLTMRMNTAKGQKLFEKERRDKRERVKTFFAAVIGKSFKVQPANFKLNGMELLSEQSMGKGTEAVRQTYALSFSNGDAKAYRFLIEVVLWKNKYHLVETDSFFS